jgi:hypothetical protein
LRERLRLSARCGGTDQFLVRGMVNISPARATSPQTRARPVVPHMRRRHLQPGRLCDDMRGGLAHLARDRIRERHGPAPIAFGDHDARYTTRRQSPAARPPRAIRRRADALGLGAYRVGDDGVRVRGRPVRVVPARVRGPTGPTGDDIRLVARSRGGPDRVGCCRKHDRGGRSRPVPAPARQRRAVPTAGVVARRRRGRPPGRTGRHDGRVPRLPVRARWSAASTNRDG